MATKIEKRSIQDRVARLRIAIYRLAHARENEIRKNALARFKRYLKETRLLAAIVRHHNPSDVVWERFFDPNMTAVDEDIHNHVIGRPIVSQSLPRFTAFELLHALDAAQAAADRIRPNIPRLQDLALRTIYGSDPIQHRQVLGDLIEENGFEGEANVIRANRSWRTVRETLTRLGVTGLPKTKPRGYKTSPSTYRTPYGYRSRRDRRSRSRLRLDRALPRVMR